MMREEEKIMQYYERIIFAVAIVGWYTVFHGELSSGLNKPDPVFLQIFFYQEMHAVERLNTTNIDEIEYFPLFGCIKTMFAQIIAGRHRSKSHSTLFACQN